MQRRDFLKAACGVFFAGSFTGVAKGSLEGSIQVDCHAEEGACRSEWFTGEEIETFRLFGEGECEPIIFLNTGKVITAKARGLRVPAGIFHGSANSTERLNGVGKCSDSPATQKS